MCTAATYQTRDFYMGRTLDYEFSYGEEIVITPRRFPIALRHGGVMDTHYAIIGTAHVADGFPLYYDAVNEKGLGMAGLNFVGSAQYAEVVPIGRISRSLSSFPGCWAAARRSRRPVRPCAQ